MPSPPLHLQRLFLDGICQAADVAVVVKELQQWHMAATPNLYSTALHRLAVTEGATDVHALADAMFCNELSRSSVLSGHTMHCSAGFQQRCLHLICY